MDEFKKKGKIILQILDKIKPIPSNAPENIQDLIDQERQRLVVRAGWNQMSIDELEKILNPPPAIASEPPPTTFPW